METITGRIVSIQRLPSSNNGNPMFRITLEHADGVGSWTTATDHSFVYTVGNPGLREDSTVVLSVGGRGTITNMRPA